MGKTEVILFFILTNIAVLILIAGLIIFIFKYRSRKIRHEEELKNIEELHGAELMNTELNMRQQTMSYIGKEIHDSVAQKLTLASIYAHKMELKSEGKAYDNISKIIDEALFELRMLSRTLVDNKLQSETLEDLIKAECDRVNAMDICEIHLTASQIPELDISVKGPLFRIVQEFIQNSIKHSACSNIYIDLLYKQNVLNLSIKDDGKGFNIKELRHRGIGLDNMRSRTLKLGGTFEIDSKETHGTSLSISLPVVK